MLKRLLGLVLGLLLLTTPNLYAQQYQTLSCGVPVYSWNAASPSNGTSGTGYALYANLYYVTWQVSYASSPASVTLTLEGSMDGSSWATIDTNSSTSGGARNASTSSKFIRPTQVARSGGSGVTVVFNCTKIFTGSSSGGGTWGSITGTLSAQTDLQAALDAKLADPGSNGCLGRTASGITVSRTLTAGLGIVITSGDCQSGDPTIGADLAVIDSFASGTGTVSATGVIGTFYFKTNGPGAYAYPNTNTPHWLLSAASGQTAGELFQTSATDVLAAITSTDDNTLVSNGSTWEKKALPNCIDSGGNHINYTASSNTFSCGTSGGGSFDGNVTTQFSLQADTTPSQITADQNDYASCTAASNAVCRLNTDAARTITGFAGGADGRVLWLINVGSNTIYLPYENTGSSAANRIATTGTSGSSMVVLFANSTTPLIYDSTSSRWRVLDPTVRFPKGTCITNGGFANCGGDFGIFDEVADASFIIKGQNSTPSAQIFVQNNNGDSLDIKNQGTGASGTTFGVANASFTSIVASSGTSGLAIGTAGADQLVLGTNDVNRIAISSSGSLGLERTITGAGTTGAQTINKMSGTVNFAAAATTLVVTNSLATTTSIVYAVRRTNDTTCFIGSVEAASGSFTIRMTAACTAETSVGFLVTN